MPRKRTIFIIGTVLVTLLIIALGVWYFMLRGEERGIADLAQGRGFGSALPFFGSPTGSTDANVTGSDTEASGTTSVPRDLPRLWQVRTVASAGATFDTTGTSSTLRLIDRPTGNVYEVNTQTGTSTRLTTTLVPEVHRAIWVSAQQVLLQTITDTGRIETFSSTIVSSTSSDTSSDETETPGELASTQLERDITHLEPLTDGTGDLVYLVAYEGSLLGIRANSTGGERTRVWESPLLGWGLQQSDGSLILTQYAAGGVAGGSYRLRSDGSMAPLITNVPGLAVTVHPTDTSRILYSSATGTRPPQLRVQTADEERTLPLATFAEKCVWSTTETNTAYCGVPDAFPSATYPDAWYRGEVHFSDRLYRINTETGAVRPLVFPQDTMGRSLDIMDMQMNAAGTHLTFIDATTQTPWVFRIAE